jgi:hypothetical protein
LVSVAVVHPSIILVPGDGLLTKVLPFDKKLLDCTQVLLSGAIGCERRTLARLAQLQPWHCHQ